MGPILLIVLLVLLIAGLPNWPYMANYGWGPSGGIGLIVLVVIILLLLGRI